MTHAGVVSEAGSCCSATPTANVTLDRAGQCCSEALDACGVCGGDGLTMDFTGACCTGAVDASGLCCASPNVVDDFGVCGGNSSTGVILLDMDVLSATVTGAPPPPPTPSPHLPLISHQTQVLLTSCRQSVLQCNLLMLLPDPRVMSKQQATIHK